MANERLDIASGITSAKKITKTHAKSFYFASLSLTPTQKRGAYSIYAICRLSDDAVDKNYKNKEKILEKIRKNIDLAYSNQNTKLPLILAFRKTINDFKIPKKYFKQLHQGMKMDLEKNTYQNFKELYRYCYRVAGVVGLMMLFIFGFKERETKKYAIFLGVAMQLTNILRDIKQDHQQGRIYLPQDELKRFKITIGQLKEGRVDENFVNFMKYQIKRAKAYYQESEKGIKMITSWQGRLTVFLMRNIYSAILDKIEKNNYNIFSKRAHTNFGDKIFISLSTILKFRYL